MLAHELDAQFDELILASVQNVIEMQGKGFNLGIGLTSATLDNIGASLQTRSRHVVDELSYIVGTETARVIVGNALRLNGAMIANAERNADGSFTDRGHLTLIVGELFLQHIRDYDNGKTMGASVNLMKQTEVRTADGTNLNSFTLQATIGYHDEVGGTYATIGKGNVEVTKNPEVVAEANRDVTKAQTVVSKEGHTPVKLYYSNIDTKALKEGIPDSFKGWFAGVTERIKSGFFPTFHAAAPEPVAEEIVKEEVPKMKSETKA